MKNNIDKYNTICSPKCQRLINFVKYPRTCPWCGSDLHIIKSKEELK